MERLKLVVAALPVLLVAVSLGATDLYNTDLNYHLAVGRQIALEGGVPEGYPVSENAVGFTIWNGEWAFRLGAWLLYDSGGATALVILRVLLIIAMAGLLVALGRGPRDPALTPLAVLGAGIALWVAAFRLMLRPELVSYVMFLIAALLMRRIERDGLRRGAAIGLAVCAVVWVNMHNMFPILWGLVGTALLVALVRRTDIKRAAGLLLLVIVACLINPRPHVGISYPFWLAIHMAQGWNQYFAAVPAHQSPLTWSGAGSYILVAYYSATGLYLLLVGQRWRAERKLDPIELLVVLVGFALGIWMIRLIPFSVFLAVPLVCRRIGQLLPQRVAHGWPAWAVTCILAWVLSANAASGELFIRTGIDARPGMGASGSFHPRDAIETIRRDHPAGKMLNNPDCGGAVALWLHPDYRAWVDNNPHFYPAPFLDEMVALMRGEGNRDEYADRHGINVGLFNYAGNNLWSFLGWLYRHADWSLIHIDGDAVVFVRAPRGAGSLEAKLEARDVELSDRAYTVAQLLLESTPRQIRLWSWPASPDPVPDRERGRLYRAFGLNHLAASHFYEALRKSPRDTRLFNDLAESLLAAGRGSDAEPLLLEVLRIDPDNRVARHNLSVYRDRR